MNIKSFIQKSAPNGKTDFPCLFRLFAITGLLAWAQLASATPSSADSARKQVHSSAIASASEAIKREAKNRAWPRYQAKMNVFVPAEVSRYAPCRQPLRVSLPGGERIDLSRLRYDIRCEDKPGWDVAVTVKPDIYLPIAIAKKSLERGHLLTPDDITLKKLNIANTRGGYIINPDEAVGLTAKRRLRELQPITLSQLESPVLVERGQRVLMIAEQNGIEARTMGEAMKKGRKGEIIKVKNESSQRVVSAIVDDIGVVRMVFASGK